MTLCDMCDTPDHKRDVQTVEDFKGEVSLRAFNLHYGTSHVLSARLVFHASGLKREPHLCRDCAEKAVAAALENLRVSYAN